MDAVLSLSLSLSYVYKYVTLSLMYVNTEFVDAVLSLFYVYKYINANVRVCAINRQRVLVAVNTYANVLLSSVKLV